MTINSLQEAGGRRVFAEGVTVAEEAAAHLGDMGRIGLEAYCREAAIACDKGAYALPDEGLEIFLRVVFDGEPVVVGVGVDEARGERESAEVNHLVIRAGFDAGCYFSDAFSADEKVCDGRLCERAVINLCVFEQYHCLAASAVVRD